MFVPEARSDGLDRDRHRRGRFATVLLVAVTISTVVSGGVAAVEREFVNFGSTSYGFDGGLALVTIDGDVVATTAGGPVASTSSPSDRAVLVDLVQVARREGPWVSEAIATDLFGTPSVLLAVPADAGALIASVPTAWFPAIVDALDDVRGSTGYLVTGWTFVETRPVAEAFGAVDRSFERTIGITAVALVAVVAAVILVVRGLHRADIERRRAEALAEALRVEGELRSADLHLALEATLTGWFEWDLSTGRMQWRSIPGMHGSEETVPSSVDEALALVDPDYHADLMRCLDDVCDGATCEIEFRSAGLGPDEPEWVWLHMTPICNDSGEVDRVIGLARDVTVRRRALNAVLEAVDRQRDVAATLQQALLPVRVPAVDGVAISAHYRPAGSDAVVGGDFYDIVETDHGFNVYVGDVCGHGLVAAVTTSLARHTLRAALRAGQPLRRQLQWLHRAVFEDAADQFVTCGAMHCERASAGEWDASVILAGHPPAMLVRDGRASFVGVAGMLLGVFDPLLNEVRLRLLPGDRIVWYTDGLSDAARPRLTESELLAVAESGAHLTTAEFAALLMTRSTPRTGTCRDDTALVVIDVLPVTV